MNNISLYTRQRSLLYSIYRIVMASKENLTAEELKTRIDEQGNLVRKLKSDTNSNKVND